MFPCHQHFFHMDLKNIQNNQIHLLQNKLHAVVRQSRE